MKKYCSYGWNIVESKIFAWGSKMNRTDIVERIAPIFQDILEQDDLILTDDLSAEDIANWDSLSHVRLIVSIEQELDVKFDLAEISNVKNVGDMVELIEKLLS